MSGLPARLDAALRARGYPPYGGASKRLAFAIGRCYDALARYRNGKRIMSADTLVRLINHFAAAGDTAFAAEVMGDACPTRETIHYWATDKGVLHRVNDLAVFAAQSRGLDGVAGDHAAAARRNLGWISATVAGGVATVEYHERGISARAVSAAADAIRHTAAVCRTIAMQEGRRITLGNELPRDAIHALEVAASSKSMASPLPWSVVRLNPDRVSGIGRQLCSSALTAGGLLNELSNRGILPQVSLFKCVGEEVILLQAGASAGIRPSIRDQMVGERLSAWPDWRYGRLTLSRIEEAERSGPIYHSLTGGTVHGIIAPHRSTMVAKDGYIASYTERDGIAA